LVTLHLRYLPSPPLHHSTIWLLLEVAEAVLVEVVEVEEVEF
jgi:hypothetical protein